MTAKSELENVVRSYFAALNEADLEQLAATLTDDVVLMLHDAPTVNGRDAARDTYTQHFANVSFDRVLHIDEADLDGNLGYVRSHSTGTVTPQATGTPNEVPARELFLLKKTNDAWKIQSYAMNHLSH